MSRRFSQRENGVGGGRGRHASPPPGTGRAPERALPAQLTPLVGREREIDEARARLAGGDARLITFTGPAGIGKTRLALAVGAAAADLFPDGVCFVDLSTLDDAGRLDETLAAALGIHEATRTPFAALAGFLRERRLLLILDNFEQLLDAAPTVANLLARCPTLCLLVTSRALLRVYGEHEFDVPPLAVPPAGSAGEDTGESAAPLGPDDLLDYAAVRLFVQRAQAAARTFALTEENADAVARLCRRLDGLPLAIELTAAQSKQLSPRAMLARLESAAGLPPPRDGVHGRPARHQTLRDAIGWSYALLSDDERRLFRRLAVFVGGFSEEAAAAVAPQPAGGVLQALAEHSLLLVSRAGGPEAGARFAMLETIRDVAREELVAAGEDTDAARRHAAYFTALARRANLRGDRQGYWLTTLEREHDNLRAALAWTASAGDARSAALLASSLWWFWCRRGHLAEGRAWLETALALCARDDALPDSLRMQTLNAAGALAWYQGDQAAAAPWLEQGRALAERLDDRDAVAHALMFQGLVALRLGDRTVARARLEQSVALRRARGDRWGTAMSLTCLAGVPIAESEYAEARRLEEESAALFREVGDRWSMTSALFGLGTIAFYQGDFAAARRHLDEVLAIRREVGDTWATASTLHSLGMVARAGGERDRALAYFQESLTTPRALGNRFVVAQGLAGVAGVAADAGRHEQAARLFGAAAAIFDAVAARLQPLERRQVEQDTRAVRAALGAARFRAIWEQGRALDAARAVQEALDIRLGRALPAVAPPPPPPSRLTPREREVAALIARGYTNRQIAGALTITEGTAGSHVEHILAKLGFQSRAQIAAWTVAELGAGRDRTAPEQQ